MAYLIQEDDSGLALSADACNFAKALTHQSGLHPHLHTPKPCVTNTSGMPWSGLHQEQLCLQHTNLRGANITLQLSARHKRSY